MTEAPAPDESSPEEAAKPKAALWKRLAPWAITIVCFGYLYTRIASAAGPDQSLAEYLGGIFASVSWWRWLALMVPYSIFFFLIDTLVLWRVISWFNAKVPYRDLVPVRASTYIISILNEQVGKGAMALYLNRRNGVPVLEIVASMFFIMFCEFFYLLGWANFGYALRSDVLPDLFGAIPIIGAAALVFLAGFIFYFRSERFAGSKLRERTLLRAFRQASPGQYLTVVALRSPALLAAVFVYTRAVELFGVSISLADMMGYLPVIFFGTLIPGPFRAVAVTMWPTLFPGNEGQLAAFGFVQHNFFVLFNAAIGLIFLRRANREILQDAPG